MFILGRTVRLLVLFVLALPVGGAARPGGQPVPIVPGDARLRPNRVRLATDTIVVLVRPVDGPERTVAMLVRRLERVAGAGADAT